jgi:hypothetical protein
MAQVSRAQTAVSEHATKHVYTVLAMMVSADALKAGWERHVTSCSLARAIAVPTELVIEEQ